MAELYNDNPTLEGLKKMDEARQGEVFEMPANDTASKLFYIESYGCQMNFNDSEVVASILAEDGFGPTRH